MSARTHTQLDRGREAEKPQQIPLKGWKDVLVRAKREMDDDHATLIAAGVAFFGLLSIFPAIAALVSIWALVSSPEQIVEQLQKMQALLPPAAADILTGQAREVVADEKSGTGWAAILGILLALWSASKGMKSLIEGINIAYDETDERGFIRKTVITLALTVVAVVGLVVAAGVVAALPIVLDTLQLGDGLQALFAIAPWPILFVGGLLMLSIIYRFGPDRDAPKWSWLSWGAAAAMIIWTLGSITFSIYVSNFEDYNATYGAIGGVIVLLLWLWLSALSVLIGAEINAELERQTRKDTTKGPPKQMGQRGAYAADTVGEATNEKKKK